MLRPARHKSPGLRQPHIPVAAHEQRPANPLLEPFDPLAQCGLRHIQPVRSTSEVQRLGESGDGCERPSGSAISGLAFLQSTSNYPARFSGGLFFTDYARNCIWFAPAGTGGEPDFDHIEGVRIVMKAIERHQIITKGN